MQIATAHVDWTQPKINNLTTISGFYEIFGPTQSKSGLTVGKKHQRGECSTCNCKRFPSETPELFGLLKPELTRIDKTTLTTTIWLLWVRSRNCDFFFFTKDYDLSCVACIVTPHSMLPTRNKRLSMSCSLQVS